MPLVLLAVEDWRDRRGARGRCALAAAGALLVTWLQPWQGGTLVLVIAAAEALHVAALARAPGGRAARRARRGLRARGLLRGARAHRRRVGARRAGQRGRQPGDVELAVVGDRAHARAARRARGARLPDSRRATWQDLAARVWPLAALRVYLAPVGTFPYHAFQGMAIPLAVLAVQGVLLGLGAAAARGSWSAALALMVVPGTVHRFEVAVNSIRAAGDPYFVFPGEQAALDALEADPRPGGVLAPAYGGHMLPYRTGREVYVGALSWTPDWEARVRETRALFEGDMAAGGGAGARAPLRRALRVRRLPAGAARPAARARRR